jgi:hypothetical protein
VEDTFFNVEENTMSDPSYIKTCECGKKWLADGKSICPACQLARKKEKWTRLAKARAARRAAREKRRMSKRNR